MLNFKNFLTKQSGKKEEIMENQTENIEKAVKEEVKEEVKIEEAENFYTLIEPLVIGREGGEFKHLDKIEFREPTAGDLRGLTLTKVFESDIDSWLILLSRITTPKISTQFLERMNAADMSMLINKAVSFLARKVKLGATQAK
jgi:hypothetical protein